MKKKSQVKNHIYIASGVLIISLGILAFYFFVNQNKQTEIKNISSNIKTSTMPVESEVIIPTIIPSADKAWSKFIYPDSKKRFSFEFPTDWGVVRGDAGNTFPEIIFTFSENGEKFKFTINPVFSGEYQGEGITSSNEVKRFANRNFNVKTIYQNKTPILIVIYFEDFDIDKDAIQVMNMDIPPSRSEVYLNILNKILNSFEF